MDGTGVPLVTPFDSNGTIAADRLEALVSWVVDAGIDFVVPCGSNGESELMSVEERASVVETVVEAASVPVLAGTGHPGLAETRRQTALAADAGADGALVVTPYYYSHDQATIERYYRLVADASDIPVYLYNVPGKTGVSLEPETVASVADHDNIHGLKDSSGDLIALQRERRLTGDDFELFVGNGSLYAQGLDVGTDGGVLAMANVVPDLASEIWRRHTGGDADGARELNGALVDLNQAVTARYGVPGVKAAMRARDQQVGHLRSPLSPLDGDQRAEVEDLLAVALD